MNSYSLKFSIIFDAILKVSANSEAEAINEAKICIEKQYPVAKYSYNFEEVVEGSEDE